MSMVLTILLAMVAEAGGLTSHRALEPARISSGPAIRSLASVPAPSRSMSSARKSYHRACSGFWSLAGLEEFDTEEVDETWMVHLDAVATVPGSYLCLAWSRSRSETNSVPGLELSPLSYFPLRC